MPSQLATTPLPTLGKPIAVTECRHRDCDVVPEPLISIEDVAGTIHVYLQGDPTSGPLYVVDTGRNPAPEQLRDLHAALTRMLEN